MARGSRAGTIFSVMMVFRIISEDTKKAAVQPPSSGNRLKGCLVVSKAKTTEVGNARDAGEHGGHPRH